MIRWSLMIGACIAVITLAAYWQVGHHEFTNYDDDIFVVDNQHVNTGFNWDNVQWAFTPVPGIGWYPIAWLAHMLDVELYGLRPRGHHLSNLLLHLASTLLLLAFLIKTTQALWPSAFVAALFALHPLHVEPVAWIAERRELLSTLFAFLTLTLYAHYVAKPRWFFYCGALATFVLGLMAKPMVVTVPVVMLLLDYWPLERYRFLGGYGSQGGGDALRRRFLELLLEKLPFFGCALLTVVMVLQVPPLPGNAAGGPPLWPRMANAATAYLKYIGKMIWPSELAAYYPFPAEIPWWQVAGALLFLSAVTVASVRAGRKHLYLPVGWLWFAVTLVPVLGLVHFGNHAIADRYTYLPLTGLFIMVAWGVPVLFRTLLRKKVTLAVLAGGTIAAAAVMTWRQAAVWQNSLTLHRHTLAVTGANHVVHNDLGNALKARGDVDGAIEEYRKALSLRLDSELTHVNLGLAFAEQGRLNEAVAVFTRAVAINPGYFDAHYNLGIAHFKMQRPAEALAAFERAISIDPQSYQAYNNYGFVLASEGLLDEAMTKFNKAIAINPEDFLAHYNLGKAMLSKRQYDEAQAEFGKALEIQPGSAEARRMRSVATEALVNRN